MAPIVGVFHSATSVWPHLRGSRDIVESVRGVGGHVHVGEHGRGPTAPDASVVAERVLTLLFLLLT